MKRILSVLCLMLICFSGVALLAAEARIGSLSGKVMVSEGVPMSNGVIYIFSDASGPPPSADRYWRVPDEIVKTRPDGSFAANVVNGTYYIGAIQRKSGDDIGPPQEGDLFLPFHGQKEPQKYVVASGAKVDVGVVTGAAPFKKSSVKTSGEGITSIEGKVLDSRKKPVKNALVFAYLTPARVGKPLFISERTGKDGKYLLRVSEGGSYYLKVRNNYGGGAMKAGEIMGTYGLKAPVAVKVETGTNVKEINITGVRFSGRKKK